VRRKDVLGLINKYLYTFTNWFGAMLAKTTSNPATSAKKKNTQNWGGGGLNQAVLRVRGCLLPGFVVEG
jgi:hypothetical protein